MDGSRGRRRHHEVRIGILKQEQQTENREVRHSGAKTFRRGRVLAFLESLESNRALLKKQLVQAELETINPVIVGELKATEAIIHEFKRVFELHEHEVENNPDADQD